MLPLADNASHWRSRRSPSSALVENSLRLRECLQPPALQPLVPAVAACNVGNLIKKPWAFIRVPYMNPTILGL